MLYNYFEVGLSPWDTSDVDKNLQIGCRNDFFLVNTCDMYVNSYI